MLTIEEDIVVPVPPARIWAVVSDPAEVVSCIGGAELGQLHEDGSFDGTLVVKFGAVRVRFGARLTLELDESVHEGRLSARGKDGQGATRFTAQATFRVVEDTHGGGSRVEVAGEITLAGKLASLVESGAGAVVTRMTREFSTELVGRCTGEQRTPPPAPVRRSWWTALRAWWQRWIGRQEVEQAGSVR